MDIVVYDKKCIKSVNFSYSLTTVTKKTQSHRVRKKLNRTDPPPTPPPVKTRMICINLGSDL